MKLKPNREALRLRRIPQNTVVHTPTEAEAKELLALLHENGYKWKYCGDSLFDPIHFVGKEGFCIEPGKRLSTYIYIQSAKEDNCTILTLAAFKEKYVEEEKPQPKFKVGDKVRILGNCGCNAKGVIGTVERAGERGLYVETAICRLFVAFDEIEPYTEPETKEETMETKDETKDEAKEAKGETKELNLVELLEGHEGESIFLTTMGNVFIESVSEINIRFKPHKTSKDSYLLKASGKMNEHGLVIAFPSRALYEQYPLDPLKAWSVWQEEQERSIHIKVVKAESDYTEIYQNLYFRTPADRDKCIEEIKAVIEKYSK